MSGRGSDGPGQTREPIGAEQSELGSDWVGAQVAAESCTTPTGFTDERAEAFPGAQPLWGGWPTDVSNQSMVQAELGTDSQFSGVLTQADSMWPCIFQLLCRDRG